jgi:hypothetical protein
MRIRMGRFTAWRLAILPVAIAVAGAAVQATVQRVDAGNEPILAPPTEFEVEITDREKGFDFKGWAFSEVPVKIIIRNKNHVTHGFTSPLFNEIPIRMEGQGSEIRGKHFKSFHLDPGKTMTLHFTPPMKKHHVTGQPEHQYHMVWCDIHPEAKGELHIVETSGEIGGG